MLKLGRNARTFNPRVPHMSALLGAMTLPPVPESVDWTHNVTDFGMMLNDTLGDCTCAAVYHARQVWSMNTITEQTETDAAVLKLYEEACGYRPGDPNSDNGGVEQNVLEYLLNKGMPLSNGGVDKILAFVEVDPRNVEDVKRTINDCGVAYIGFNVPSNLISLEGDVPSLWELDKDNTDTDGGHAIVLVGYDTVGPTLISWGSKYKMTWEFFTYYTDEVYAIASDTWRNNTGKTPLGLSLDELEALMRAIKR